MLLLLFDKVVNISRQIIFDTRWIAHIYNYNLNIYKIISNKLNKNTPVLEIDKWAKYIIQYWYSFEVFWKVYLKKKFYQYK